MDIREYVKKLRRAADVLEDLYASAAPHPGNETPTVAEAIRKRVGKKISASERKGKRKRSVSGAEIHNQVMAALKKPMSVLQLAKRMGYKSPTYLYKHVKMLADTKRVHRVGDESPAVYEVTK